MIRIGDKVRLINEESPLCGETGTVVPRRGMAPPEYYTVELSPGAHVNVSHKYLEKIKDGRISGWVGVDLDRTLAYYDEWRGVTHVGKPIPPMVEFVQNLLAQGEEVRIFTARCAPPNDYEDVVSAVGDWCEEHIGVRLAATCTKDMYCKAIYDDIAYRVEENTGRICV